MDLTPQKIVSELNRFIVGQAKAKTAVAIALRNRWRRQQVPEPLRNEITPKNILMIGPTGVGKTEIARRLAKLAHAPFIKVEATKFTEVGYVGRDVDSIIRDLVDLAIKDMRAEARLSVRQKAEKEVEEKILDILLPGGNDLFEENETRPHNPTRETLRQRLQEGKLEEREIEIEVAVSQGHVEIMGPPGIDEIAEQLREMMQQMKKHKVQRRKLKIVEARRHLLEEYSEKLINEDDLKAAVVTRVEQSGIVFLDEIDKITARGGEHNADVSRAGVQRDLLPLVEGTTVITKLGAIKTDHILFIASGAFHLSKPSDLIPELQGRFPIRVELEPLKVEDFIAILHTTDACLTAQYTALLATEHTTLNFTADGIQRIAQVAFDVNESQENIGARRLYTIMEKLLEDISFHATAGMELEINAEYVDKQLKNIVQNRDLSRYIL